MGTNMMDEMDKIFKNASSWLYAVAALSLVNMFLISSSTRFLAGLYFTELFLVFAEQEIYIAVTIVMAALIFFLGIKARKGSGGALITGLIVYIFECLALVLFMLLSIGLSGDDGQVITFWTFAMDIVFHLLILVSLIAGLISYIKIKKLNSKNSSADMATAEINNNAN